jgi:hypothetical protein
VENPIRPCGVLTTRFYERVALALSSEFLGPFLQMIGARRDYLALASKKLLERRVSLDEAGFLVGILLKVWKETKSFQCLGESRKRRVCLKLVHQKDLTRCHGGFDWRMSTGFVFDQIFGGFECE